MTPRGTTARRVAHAALGLLLLPAAARADVLGLDFCTGVAPVTWAFRLTPTAACREVSVAVASPDVQLLAAHAGPGLPSGWTVSLEGASRVVARGEADLAEGVTVPQIVIAETNRATAGISERGARPVSWRVELRNAAGELVPDGSAMAAFPPVLELPDAVSRGLVMATAKARSTWGLVDVTVDNPTMESLCLDLPPGTILRGDGEDWVVGLVRPFSMLRKQKASSTVVAFPAVPRAGRALPPRRLAWTSQLHPAARELEAIVLAVRELKAHPEARGRVPGALEVSQPFDFWPLVGAWAFWTHGGHAPPQVLLDAISQTLRERASAGDGRAAGIDLVTAADDVRNTALLVLDMKNRVDASSPLPLGLQASQARFN
jgi:hypothetical protein